MSEVPKTASGVTLVGDHCAVAEHDTVAQQVAVAKHDAIG
jgi:hypothetical protein